MNIDPDWFQNKVRELEKKQFLIGPSVENTGVSAAWVIDGQLSGYGTAGYRNRQSKSPVTAATLFPIASITKSFTATWAVETYSELKIPIDQPIATLMKSIKFPTREITEQANLVDLLSHRMGMPRHDALWFYQEYEPDEIFSHLADLDFNPLDGSGFRNSFQYNNIFYALAAAVAQSVSGRSWKEETRRRYFEPLGMKSSFTEFSEVPGDLEIAQPYFRELPTEFFKRWTVAPAASIFSNPIDLTRWLLFQMGATQSPHLSEEVRNSLFNPWNSLGDAPEIGNCFENNQYGLGWFIDSLGGLKLVHHAGSINGTSTMAAMLPDLKTGVVVCVNQVQSKLAKYLSQAILAKIIGLPEGFEEKFKPKPLYSVETLMPVWGTPELDAKNPYLNAPSNTQVPSEWMGTFESPSYGKLRVFEETGNLKFEFGKYQFNAKVLHSNAAVLLANWIGMPSSLKVKFDQGTWKIPFNLYPGCFPTEFKK